MKKAKGKVTGFGGIFFKSENPEKLKKWYAEHLRLDTDQYGHMFKWFYPDDPAKMGFTQWSIFEHTTDYLDPGKKDFMMNFIVENLHELVEELKEDGMQLIGEIEEYDYGSFAWVMDPEGNKLELWEPKDSTSESPNS